MKYFVWLCSICMFSGIVFGEECPLDDAEIRALRDWVKQKKQQVHVKDFGGKLSLSGEVRTEYQSKNEVRNGIKQIGSNSAHPDKAKNVFDVEVNLLLNYRADRTWAAVKIEYDNDMGTKSGSFNKISLERAYFGGRLISADTYTVDATIGRRNFSEVFDSRIQFGSFMDGIVLLYDQAFDFLGDFYVHGGPFIINEKKAQFGCIGEAALLNLFGTGFYTKYSLIDWNGRKVGTSKEHLQWHFLNSQVILGYRSRPKWLNGSFNIFLAGLLNSAARPHKVTNNKRSRWGAYAGFTLGEVRKKGDWSFSTVFQAVAAQAVPPSDSSGIGTNNAEGAGLYSTKIDGTGGRTDLENARGSGNYKGYGLEFLYMLTNNITLSQSWAQAWTLNTTIGPHVRFRQYELEFIYAF